ncbi:MAG: MBL fold metallo-hydrolase [Alphaproteobacteria bacterium]|nr:MBL fold metallo-hydrolase [Alphaproteobacteria bacterium]
MLTWRIGDVTIKRIVELEATGGSAFILPEATPDLAKSISWLFPHFADATGNLKMSVHALLIETPTIRLIVDTCIGNDKQRDIPNWSNLQTRFLDEITAAGFPRESIDVVLCTHLHVDHVGWNTMLVEGKWTPTFPNARYLIGRDEFEYWRKEEEQLGNPATSPFGDSVKPVFDAGLVELVTTTHRVSDEISLEPTLGHTPGHVSVRIRSKGEQALITGDFMHHPCQIAKPDMSSAVDFDPKAAAATRRRMFESLAGDGTLVIGTHFAAPTAGRIVPDGAVWRFAV